MAALERSASFCPESCGYPINPVHVSPAINPWHLNVSVLNLEVSDTNPWASICCLQNVVSEWWQLETFDECNRSITMVKVKG